MLLSGSVVLLVYVALCIVLSAAGDRDIIVIPTDAGSFLGQLDDTIEHNGERRSVKRFLGIPFAKPPVGDRRFAKPEVPDVMQKVYNATYYRPYCPQIDFYGDILRQFDTDEDCLYLNMYIPDGGQSTRDQTFPVIIWIHGGSFSLGGVNAYNGDVLSSFNDVIVVTIHYRLNVFGFLSDEENLHGNYGMWDQRLAIEWVNKHIESFGGDKGRVTLCGESAGAASVLYQALYPGNKGLFHRVIAQSGNILAPWALQKNPVKNFRDLVNRINCNKGNHTQTLQCLRGISVEILVSNVNPFDLFGPSIDDNFLKADPVSLFMASDDASWQHFKNLDFLSGVNSNDSVFAIHLSTNVTDILRPLFSSESDNVAAIAKAALHLYANLSNHDSTDGIIDRIKIDLASDINFFVPAIKTALGHADSKKGTYLYEFDHKPWFTPKPQLKGAIHGMELAYVFGLTDSMISVVTRSPRQPPDSRYDRPVEEVALASTVMALWTNFAKTGNPTSPGVSGVPDWPVYDSSSQSYLQISMNMTVKRRLAAERYAFWTEVVPSIRSRPTSATPGYIHSGPIWNIYFKIIFSLHFATAFAFS